VPACNYSTFGKPCPNEAVPGGKWCEHHRRKGRRTGKRHAAKKAACGFCRYGGCYVTPAEGHSYCHEHREYFRTYARTKRKRAHGGQKGANGVDPNP
jgi:hypothetical protein